VDSLESDGLFWLPASPDTTVAGRLRFLPEAGVSELALIGNITAGQEPAESGERYSRILGVAGIKLVTLEDCFQTSYNWHSTGVMRQRIRVGRILAGAWFEEGEPLIFEGIAVVTDQLANWVGRSGVSTVMKDDPSTGVFRHVELRYDRPKSESVSVLDGTLTLDFSYGVRSNDKSEHTIVEGCSFRISLDSATSLDDLLFYSEAIQHLLTIAVGTPAQLDSVRLWHPDVVYEAPNGRRTPEPIEFLAQQVDNLVPTRRLSPVEMLFTFEQIGGLRGVAAWLSVAKRYRPVLGSLMSSRYMARMYTENRFFNAAFAAESFHRLRFANELRPRAEFKELKRELVRSVPEEWQDWLKEQLQYSNEPRLRFRLEEMAEYAGEVFAQLVGDVSKWSKLTKDCRNSLAHYDNRAQQKNTGNLYYLSESLFYLTVFCLLRECGVGDAVVSGSGQNNHLCWLKEKMDHLTA
jgi:hypothetical protein